MRPATATRPRLPVRDPLGVLRPRRRGASRRHGGRFVPLSLIFRSARASRAVSTTQVIRAGDGADIEIAPRIRICLQLSAIMREQSSRSDFFALLIQAPIVPRERAGGIPATRSETLRPPAVSATSYTWFSPTAPIGSTNPLPPRGCDSLAPGERGHFDILIEWARQPSAPESQPSRPQRARVALHQSQQIVFCPASIDQTALQSRQLSAPTLLHRSLILTHVAAASEPSIHRQRLPRPMRLHRSLLLTLGAAVRDRKPPQPRVGQGRRLSVRAGLPGTAHERTNSFAVQLSRPLEPVHSGRAREQSGMEPGRSLALSLPPVAAQRVDFTTTNGASRAGAAEREYRATVPTAGRAIRYGSPVVQYLPIEIRWREAKRPPVSTQAAPAPAPTPQPQPDLARLTREVSRELEKRLRVERQRHGRL